MITCYFFVDPSINPDPFNPIQLPDFVSDLFGIHNTFSTFHLCFSVNSDRPVFCGASDQRAGGIHLQRQDLFVSGPAGGCRNQPKETGQMNESKPRRRSKRMMGTHTPVGCV
jgi:hypothetical protein